MYTYVYQHDVLTLADHFCDYFFFVKHIKLVSY